MNSFQFICDSPGTHILSKFQNFQRGDLMSLFEWILTTRMICCGQKKSHKLGLLELLLQTYRSNIQYSGMGRSYHYKGKIDSNCL